MTVSRRQRLVLGQAVWMFVTLVLLAILSALSLGLFFITSLVGFLVLVEVTAPFNLSVEWRTRLKWIILAGLAGFGYLVVQRLLSALPFELL